MEDYSKYSDQFFNSRDGKYVLAFFDQDEIKKLLVNLEDIESHSINLLFKKWISFAEKIDDKYWNAAKYYCLLPAALLICGVDFIEFIRVLDNSIMRCLCWETIAAAKKQGNNGGISFLEDYLHASTIDINAEETKESLDGRIYVDTLKIHAPEYEWTEKPGKIERVLYHIVSNTLIFDENSSWADLGVNNILCSTGHFINSLPGRDLEAIYLPKSADIVLDYPFVGFKNIKEVYLGKDTVISKGFISDMQKIAKVR